MTFAVKPRSVKKWIILSILQVSVIAIFIASAGLVIGQIPKVVGAVQYYLNVGSEQTDRKLDEASDSAGRIEEELVQEIKKGTMSSEEFQAKLDQLKTAESNRSRALGNYKP